MNPVKLFLFIIAIPLAYYGIKAMRNKKTMYGIILVVLAVILLGMSFGLQSIFQD